MKAIHALFLLLSLTLGWAKQTPRYHEDVAPIFREYCLGCHNERDYDGDLSMETYAAFLEGGESGEPILVKGDPAQSYFLQTMRHVAKPAMPPRKKPQPSPVDIELLESWVRAGAPG
ncbi:MAG: c-type cytochrome domain-containing protein, partial [Verrucomicrobiota bacterium]